MKLLIFTQKVDKNDSVLGFFHGWITEIGKMAESVEVICLYKGEYNLPKNVTVYSLGKEEGVSRFVMLKRLFSYIYLISGSYDRVFVHMNQEYVVLLGAYWRLKGIPVYMWRNHVKGDFLTFIAVFFSTKLFCTSSDSFTARFKKKVIMPAGIDTNFFRPVEGAVRKKYSICMVGRVSPIKHIELSLHALKILVTSGEQVSLTILGPVLPRDEDYYNSIRKYATDNQISSCVRFLPGVSPDKLPEVYSSHEVCLNFTDSGSFDKTIVESASCGAIPLLSNRSLQSFVPEECFTENDPELIAKAIKNLLNPHTQIEIQKKLAIFIKSQSLQALVDKLSIETE